GGGLGGLVVGGGGAEGGGWGGVGGGGEPATSSRGSSCRGCGSVTRFASAGNSCRSNGFSSCGCARLAGSLLAGLLGASSFFGARSSATVITSGFRGGTRNPGSNAIAEACSTSEIAHAYQNAASLRGGTRRSSS